MTVFESIKTKSVEELADWIYKHDVYLVDETPWIKWFDGKYCGNCEVEIVHIPDNDRRMPCSWCELHDGKCKYFKDLKEVPDDKQMIKMWLESEVE